MKLPKLDMPNYNDSLPVSGRNYTYRPYTVKEEKILLMGMQGDSVDDKMTAAYQIITICSDVNPKEDHPADVEWAYLKIRACSVGSSVEVNYNIAESSCKYPATYEEKCPKTIKAGFSIDAAYVVNLDEMEKHATRKNNTWIVRLSETVAVQMRVKVIDSFEHALYEMTDAVIDGDTVFNKSDFTKEEFAEFVDDLPSPATKKLKDFLSAAPVTAADIKTKCKVCGKDFEYNVRGLIGFLV